MTKNLTTALVFFAALAAGSAGAQTLGNTNQLGQAATSQAVISPGALTVNQAANSPFTYGAVDQRYSTNQSASTAPAFGVQGMGCARPGSGFTAQIVGGGLSTAIAGENDPGCDAPRDINTMNMVGGFTAEDKQRRACMVPSIAKSSKLCRKLAEEDRAEAILEGTEPVAQRKPWTAGG